MNKKILVTIAASALVLTGAGCANNDIATPTPDTGSSTPSSTPQTTFSVQGSSTEHSVVDLSWTLPANLPDDATVRLLHSAKTNVTFPGRSYWQELTKDKTNFKWEGVPSGNRYFRICVFVKGACTDYSNEIGITVK